MLAIGFSSTLMSSDNDDAHGAVDRRRGNWLQAIRVYLIIGCQTGSTGTLGAQILALVDVFAQFAATCRNGRPAARRRQGVQVGRSGSNVIRRELATRRSSNRTPRKEEPSITPTTSGYPGCSL
ncbi:MAG TPA: hypothetical protein VGO04_03260 [Ensifer sp.]|uniref:hypothetical protein n=1 Tax=Ensifer sp. TaxID=1872086 RepID=UPI002E11A30A|nr:hypothetical protein [Ensifer sp.]